MMYNDTDAAPASKRERAMRLIRALLEKTVARGATEAEAMVAAAKAGQLMAQYNVAYREVKEVEEDRYGVRKRTYGKTKRLHELTDTWWYVAQFTGTECYFNYGEIAFFGQAHDTELAHYLLTMFVNVGESAWQAFRKAGKGETSIRGRKAFMRGMVWRLKERLTELTRQRQAAERAEADRQEAERRAQGSTGTSLMVLIDLKARIVKERYKSHGEAIGLRKGRGTVRSWGVGEGNYHAGVKAANAVNITTGVGQASRGALK